MEYATLQTTNQLWRNKIEFNERGLRKRQPRNRSRNDTNSDNDNNDQDQTNDNQSPNGRDTPNSNRTSSHNKNDPLPIFHHLTQDLTQRIQDFNLSILPPTAFSSHPPSPSNFNANFNSTTARRSTLQRHKAAHSLQHKISAVTVELTRYVESMRSNHEDMQCALTEMEGIADLLAGYWRIWGGGDDEYEMRDKGPEREKEMDRGERKSW